MFLVMSREGEANSVSYLSIETGPQEFAYAAERKEFAPLVDCNRGNH